MKWLELLKAILFGIVEGITEWLPVSSTGHMILLDEFISLDLSPAFKSTFLVVIQLGAILAVVLLYWHNIWPFPRKTDLKSNRKVWTADRDILHLWLKILIACVPAAVIGVLFDDKIDEVFYNYTTVSIMLIVVGVAFILIENYNKKLQPSIVNSDQITYKMALLVGVFQLFSAIFPGTSRSGATILGGILLGMSRRLAAEFTFYLAVPVMFGASALKIFTLDFAQIDAFEWLILLVGMVVAFVVSYYVIKQLMAYIRRHDFKVFGYYRIVLGIVVLLYFGLFS